VIDYDAYLDTLMNEILDHFQEIRRIKVQYKELMRWKNTHPSVLRQEHIQAIYRLRERREEVKKDRDRAEELRRIARTSGIRVIKGPELDPEDLEEPEIVVRVPKIKVPEIPTPPFWEVRRGGGPITEEIQRFRIRLGIEILDRQIDRYWEPWRLIEQREDLARRLRGPEAVLSGPQDFYPDYSRMEYRTRGSLGDGNYWNSYKARYSVASNFHKRPKVPRCRREP
jgi:hypothetical protein